VDTARAARAVVAVAAAGLRATAFPQKPRLEQNQSTRAGGSNVFRFRIHVHQANEAGHVPLGGMVAAAVTTAVEAVTQVAAHLPRP
jgi:hypothetical protein